MEPVIEISKFETSFGNPLEWERLTDKRMSRITFNLQGASVFDEQFGTKCLALLENTLQNLKPLSRNQFNN